MTQLIAQISIAVYLLLMITAAVLLVLRPPNIMMSRHQSRQFAYYAVAAMVGEAVTLWFGGFWG